MIEEYRSCFNAEFAMEVWAILTKPMGSVQAQMVFHCNFYKRFWLKIHPILMPAINNIWKDDIHPSWRHASTS